jgi:hypothetical protein
MLNVANATVAFSGRFVGWVELRGPTWPEFRAGPVRGSTIWLLVGGSTPAGVGSIRRGGVGEPACHDCCRRVAGHTSGWRTSGPSRRVGAGWRGDGPVNSR